LVHLSLAVGRGGQRSQAGRGQADQQHNGDYYESINDHMVFQSLLSLGGVFADGDFVELEIFRRFICGHDLGQNRIPRRKAFFHP